MSLLEKFHRMRATREARQLADRAAVIVQDLGEHWENKAIEKRKPGEILPKLPPEFGKRYEEDALCLTVTERYVLVAFDGKPVLRVSPRNPHGIQKVARFNRGAEWVNRINELYADVMSKRARAEAARWAEMS